MVSAPPSPRLRKYVPGAIYCDLEPNIVNKARTGLFHPEHMITITGKGQASNNYSGNHHAVDKELIDQIFNKLRRVGDATRRRENDTVAQTEQQLVDRLEAYSR
ncbi:tubulin/FtsZ family protein [Colletotrichum truncatum]|uniref:Tubulin/FtsZ family protein n=1 Tax=Colletotrichum truncatum TaxID=5467 RepID=A0ACC3YBQ8_COLTU